jgi:hypothetical protein
MLTTHAIEPQGANAYDSVTQLSEEVIRCPSAFTGLLAERPYQIPGHHWSRLLRNHHVLRQWHATSLELLAASLSGNAPAVLAASFLDHLPDHLGWRHHRTFPAESVRPPLFFRTDEAAGGRVLEVQCPGSLWGVHEILRDAHMAWASDGSFDVPLLSVGFTHQLRSVLQTTPVVHHLLDNSSHPAGERYFIHRARASTRYFGFDADIRPQDCNFVRSHDFPTLLNENFTVERLGKMRNGAQLYDLPPVAIFDQKLLIALPFWDVTRDFYDDDVRAMFPYTTVVTPDGIRLETNDLLRIDQFSNLPRRQRGYYLKYAGSDVSRNWGSRAVYHLGKLSREACNARLVGVLEGYSLGERWIIQEEQSSSAELSYLTRSGDSATAQGHSKFSTFYGPSGPLGVLLMVESFYKVHGSSETITTVGALPTSPRDDEVDGD